MDERTRKAIEDLEQAGANAKEKIKKAGKALRSHKPIAVTSGEEKPQIITFRRRRTVGHQD